MANKSSSKKPPIKITKLPKRISGGGYRSGIGKMTRRSFVSRKAFRVLKKAGLSRGLSSGSRHSISKQEFLQAARVLEEEGTIKHRSGLAEKVFLEEAGAEAWGKLKKKNIEERIKEQAKEERKKADILERSVERRKREEGKRELIEKYRKELVEERLARVAGTESSEYGRVGGPAVLGRRSQITGRRTAMSKDKRGLLSKVREEGQSGQTGWSRPGPLKGQAGSSRSGWTVPPKKAA